MDERQKVLFNETVQAVNALRGSVENLAQEVNTLQSSDARQERNTRWLFFSVIFDIVLSIALSIGGYYLQEIQQDQRESTQETRAGQCAFANLFIKFENTSVQNPNLSPEERQQRIDSYREIHRIHDDLECPAQG